MMATGTEKSASYRPAAVDHRADGSDKRDSYPTEPDSEVVRSVSDLDGWGKEEKRRTQETKYRSV